MTKHRHVIVLWAALVAALAVGALLYLAAPAPSLEASVVAQSTDPDIYLEPLTWGEQHQIEQGAWLVAWSERGEATLWITDATGQWYVTLTPGDVAVKLLPQGDYTYCWGCAPWSQVPEDAVVYSLTAYRLLPNDRAQAVLDSDRITHAEHAP